MNTTRRTWIKHGGLALAGLTMLNEKIFSTPVHSLKDFPPGDIIKLSSNENPYGPSPMARKAMMDAVVYSNRYPWEMTTQLREKIAGRFGLTVDHVLMGAGSSEILGLVAQYAALQKGNAVSAHPTFRSWWNVAEKCGLEIIKVPLTPDKKNDLAAMLKKINSQTQMVYVCNPNNPTGTVVGSTELKNFIDEVTKKTLVLLDEAYTEYSEEPTLATMVSKNKNLVIAKTFSKIYGMAGARIGYALTHPDTIEQLGNFQAWANGGVSTVSLAGALASLEDKDFVDSCKLKNTAAREATVQTFNDLNIPYINSHTNFLYYSAKDFKGNLETVLTGHNIKGSRTVEENGKWIRISVGTMEEMKIYSTILKQIWK